MPGGQRCDGVPIGHGRCRPAPGFVVAHPGAVENDSIRGLQGLIGSMGLSRDRRETGDRR